MNVKQADVISEDYDDKLTAVVRGYIIGSCVPKVRDSLRPLIDLWAKEVDIYEFVTRAQSLRLDKDATSIALHDAILSDVQTAARRTRPTSDVIMVEYNGVPHAWRDWSNLDRSNDGNSDGDASDDNDDSDDETNPMADVEVAEGYDAILTPFILGEWEYIAKRTGGDFRYLHRMASAIVLDQVHKIVAERQAVPGTAPSGHSGLYAKSVVVTQEEEDRYFTRIGKIPIDMSWSLDGKGSRKFTAPDNGTIIIPPTADLLPIGADRLPRQMSFIGETENDVIPSKPDTNTAVYYENMVGVALENKMASLSNGVISPTASKLAILFLSTSRNHVQDLPLGMLTKSLFGTSREGEMRLVVDGLRELDNLCVYFADGTRARMFSIRMPSDVIDGRQIIGAGPSQMLLRASAEWIAANKSYDGDVIFDLSILGIPNRNMSALRLYMRQAATWNLHATGSLGKEVDTSKVPWLYPEVLGRIANALPPKAIEFLKATKGAKAMDLNMRTAVKAVVDQIEFLREAGFVEMKTKSVGKRTAFQLLPPESYNEARRMYAAKRFRYVRIGRDAIAPPQKASK